MNKYECTAKGGNWNGTKCLGLGTSNSFNFKPIKKLAIILLIMFIVTIVGVLFINIGTVFHEFTGHALVAKILGCSVSSKANIFTGSTYYDCYNSENERTKSIIIALSSITVVFFIALALWLWGGEDNIIRILSITMFFYSIIPSAFPLLAGSDMGFAIKQGFPAILGWIIYGIMTGIFGWLLIDEITEKNYFGRWLA